MFLKGDKIFDKCFFSYSESIFISALRFWNSKPTGVHVLTNTLEGETSLKIFCPVTLNALLYKYYKNMIIKIGIYQIGC